MRHERAQKMQFNRNFNIPHQYNKTNSGRIDISINGNEMYSRCVFGYVLEKSMSKIAVDLTGMSLRLQRNVEEGIQICKAYVPMYVQLNTD